MIQHAAVAAKIKPDILRANSENMALQDFRLYFGGLILGYSEAIKVHYWHGI